jgi:hypothetical protein
MRAAQKGTLSGTMQQRYVRHTPDAMMKIHRVHPNLRQAPQILTGPIHRLHLRLDAAPIVEPFFESV